MSIIYSTSTITPADRMARVAAAGRIAAERVRDEIRAARAVHAAETYAVGVIAELRAEGAVRVGFKVCHDSGWKQRGIHAIDSFEARDLIRATMNMDAEVWGIDADGEFTGTCF